MPRATFRPTIGAYVDEANSTVAYGYGASTAQGFQDSWVLPVRTDTGGDKRIYLKYNVVSSSQALSTMWPTTADTIIAADVHLWCLNTSGVTITNTVDAPREATAAWTTGVTWDTQPALNTTRNVERKRRVAGNDGEHDCRDIVQAWVDQTIVNNGLYMRATTEGSTAGQWMFDHSLSHKMPDGRANGGPFMHVEYRTVDTLPATYTDDRPFWNARALTELARSTVEYDWTLTLELADGDLEVQADCVEAAQISRRLPFLLENKFDLGHATFKLSNADGKYSPSKRSSKLYARRAINQNIKLELTVAGQTVIVFRGLIASVNTTGEGFVEIQAHQQPIEREFKQVLRQDNLDALLTIYNANPADAVYELLHNQLGVPDTQINLDSFIDAKAIWATSGFTVGTLWANRTAEEMIGLVLDASLGALYYDYKGRYSLHAWKPSEPTVTALTGLSDYELWEDFDSIRNHCKVQFGYALDHHVQWPDNESIKDWGVRELEVDNELLRVGGRAAQTALLYTQALGDPVKRGRVSGGVGLLRFELGEGVTLTDTENEIDEDCIVSGITFSPISGRTTLELIKANWPLPRRDFVNTLTWGDTLGAENYPGTATNPLSTPIPLALALARLDDGSVKAEATWQNNVGDMAPSGYQMMVNHSSTSGQLTPTSSGADIVQEFASASAEGLGRYSIYGYGTAQYPQNHYATFAVRAYADLTPQQRLTWGFSSPRKYSAIISSTSGPDWTDRRYNSRCIVLTDLYGDTTDADKFLIDGDNDIIKENLSIQSARTIPPLVMANRRSYQLSTAGSVIYQTTVDGIRAYPLCRIRGHNLVMGSTTDATTYNSATIKNTTSIGWQTSVWVYCDDPTYTGGATTYFATTDADLLREDPGRYYVGTLITTSSGSTGGSSGTDAEESN